MLSQLHLMQPPMKSLQLLLLPLMLQMLPLLPIPLPLLLLLRPLPKRSPRRESSRRNLRRQQLKLRVETEHIKCCCCCCCCCLFVSAHIGNPLPSYLSSLILSLSILSTLSARVGVGKSR